MAFPCRIDASPYTGPWLTSAATRRYLEQVWSDSFSRLLASALEHTRTKSNRQSPRPRRPAQTREFCMSVCVCMLIALLSSLFSRVRIVPLAVLNSAHDCASLRNAGGFSFLL